ncbi:MAG TPA: hypothetical protein ENK65_00290 [Helicobacteraceae bacterium]|nr:hypothetical protein [Helicobacteraceae bacterium]
MQIQLNSSIMHLEDEPLDIGYNSERVEVKNSQGEVVKIGGFARITQILISLPFIDEQTHKELENIAALIPNSDEHPVTAALIVASDTISDPKVKGINYFVDFDEAYGDWYGVRLADGPYEKELTKAICLISKDGGLFHSDIVSDLTQSFNLEVLDRKILAAQMCYTGKGCH